MLLLGFGIDLYAQDFVTRAKIEFQKKENMQRMMTNSNMPAEFRDMYPDERVTYYDLIFSGDRAIYKAGRELPKASGTGLTTITFTKNTNILFSNYSNLQKVSKKRVFDEDFILEDSIPPIQWKIGQEIRTIAGYACRKAVGRIFDSVYVVAFYADEFVVKGGPEGFHGLPGMILQLAIPRLNTVWIATKIELAAIDESVITPPVLKGKKFTKEETKTRLQKKAADLGFDDPAKFVSSYFGKSYYL